MNRLTLGTIRKTIARVMNVCESSNKIIDYLNEAQARLMAKGKFVGCVANYRFCCNQNCIVLPRQIETVESFAVCSTPGVVQNGWYSFNPSGLGLIAEDACLCGSMLIDQGVVCCYDSLDNSNNTSRIQVSTVVPESVGAGARMLIQGWDQNANWIRTIDALTGQYVEGEYVEIANVRTTVNYFSSVTGVIKPVTNGTVILSEKDDTLALVVKTIAQFESDETEPSYRKYLIPGMSEGGSCCGSSRTIDDAEECDSQYVTVRAKLRHIPVRIDTDWMLIENIGALKLMVQCILKEDRNLFGEAKVYEADAVKALQDELSSYEGDGPLPTLKYANSAGWGGAVEGVIGWPSWGGYY